MNIVSTISKKCQVCNTDTVGATPSHKGYYQCILCGEFLSIVNVDINAVFTEGLRVVRKKHEETQSERIASHNERLNAWKIRNNIFKVKK